MEKLGGSGSDNPSHTSNNIRVPLEPIPKYKKIPNGQLAFGNKWTKLSPHLAAASDHVFSMPQLNNERCLRKPQEVSNISSEWYYSNSVGFVQERVGQKLHGYVTAASVNKDSQYKQRHFGPNNGPLEALHTAENCLHQKYPKTSAVNYIMNSGTCSSTYMSIQHPNVSSASMIPDVSQKSAAQMTVINEKHLSGNWNNFTNQHQHVNTGNNVSIDHIHQKMPVENGSIEPLVILTPAQNIFLQQDMCMAKESHQQKCVSQKAIAVVTPLTQQVVTDDLYSSTLTQEKKCLEDKTVPCEKGQEHCIPHPLQTTTRESGLKSLLDEAQTDISQKSSESIQTRGFAQHEEAKEQAGPNECWNQSERLRSVSPNSISGETEGKTQSSPMVHQSSTLENVTAINHRFEDTETRMDMELPNTLTAIPVTEWSLQRLHTLISELEQKQIRHQKDSPLSNVKHEILKLFWNGEYAQLYEASKTNLYCDIMDEVRLHSETNDSVILREIPKETLNKIAPDIHILKHDSTPPKMVYKSTWLNLNVKLDDIDKEYGYPPSVTTSRSLSRIDEVLVKEQKKLEEGENEKANGTNKLSENTEQSKQSAPGHEKSSSATSDVVLNKLSKTTGQERACLSQTTSVTERGNVIMNVAPSEDNFEAYGKNAETRSGMSSSIGDQLPVFLSMKSVPGSDHKTIKQGFERLTSEMTDDILVKEKKLEEGENENANGTNKLREDAEQSKSLAPRNEKVPSVTTDNVLKKPESVDVESDCTNWLRETKGQERANLSQTTSDDESRNEITKRAPSEELVEACGENAETNSGESSSIGAHLPESLCKKSVAVSDDCTTIKQEFELLTTDMTALLVKSEIADDQDVSAYLKIQTLSPKKAKKIFFGDPFEDADWMQTMTDIETVTATEVAEKYNQKSEDEKYMKAEMISDKRNERIHNEMQLEEYCCMATWFKSLGNRNGGHCRCATKPVLGHTSGRSVNEADTGNYRRVGNNNNVKAGFGSIMGDVVDEIQKVQIISNYEDVLKLANAVSEQLMDPPLVTCQSREFTKNSKRFKSDSNGKKRKCSTSCGQHLTNMSSPLPSIDNASPPFDEKGREITKPESKMEDKIINLALYGSSSQEACEPMTTALLPTKRHAAIGFSDNVPPPPKTLNIKITSGQNGTSTRNKNAKQHLINAQTKSCVPSDSFLFKRRPKMLKGTKWHAESKEGSEGNSAETTAFDVMRGLLSHEDQQTPRSESVNSKSAVSLTSADQQKMTHRRTMKNRHSAQLRKRLTRLKRQKWISALFNRTRRQTYANEPRKGLRSPFKQPHTNSLSKGELNKGLALNFKVLPESFNLPGYRSSGETQLSLSADSASNARTSALRKRPWGPPGAWCVSPKKKRHVNSTETADVSGSSSTFQEFKKRYQEKKLRLPP